MSLLQIENLVTQYGAIVALHGISFEVEEGQIVALFNPLESADMYKIIKDLLGNNQQAALLVLDKMIDNNSVQEVFNKMFSIVMDLYRLKVKNIPLQYIFRQKHFDKIFNRVSPPRIEQLAANFIRIKELSGYDPDKNVLLFYLLKEF